MPYEAKILADSINPVGNRLTTFEITFGRPLLAELNTHRSLSRNTASSRAIPIDKIIQRVVDDPFMPCYWGKNKSGMQAEEELEGIEREVAIDKWLEARNQAVKIARDLKDLKVHKQIANRILEPFMHVTAIVTGTEWGNFFNLRCSPHAQPEIKKIADMMQELYYYDSNPKEIRCGGFHLPLIFEEDQDLDISTKMKISSARCARVSFLTHSGRRDIEADINLHDRLINDGHMSPFEHVAEAMETPIYVGNFIGWFQYRKMIPNENKRKFTPNIK